jgi:DNA polymerase III gamma/tau subunit
MSAENIERISGQAQRTELSSINNAIIEIARTINEAKTSNQPRVLLEICMVKLATTTPDGRAVSINMKRAERKMQRENAMQARQVQTQQMQDRQPVAQQQRQTADVRYTENEGAAVNITDASIEEEPIVHGPVQQSEEPIIREPVSQTDYDQIAGAQNDYDVYEDEIDAIWAEIIEDGESQTDTFTLVRTGAVPIKMNDTEFVIKVSGLAGRYLEKNRVPMENLIAKYAGGPHKMILRSEDDAETEDDLESVADKASQLLGTKVEIR